MTSQWSKRIGFIIPANNPFMEPELYQAVPPSVSLHFTRIALRKMKGLPSSVLVDDETIDLFSSVAVDVLVYACMSGSFADCEAWGALTRQRIGIPAITAASALLGAVQAFAKPNIALISHYPADRMQAVAEWFASHGIRTVSTATADLQEPSAARNLTTDDVKRLAKTANGPEVELLCLVATDLPTFGLLQRLEDELGKPVVSSNQAILWNALALAGVREEIRGFGALLRDGGNHGFSRELFQSIGAFNQGVQ